MKNYIRVEYVGEKTLNLGVHGELNKGSQISLDFKEVQYLEKSKDGWPKYLKKIEGSESDVKLPKKVVGAVFSAYKAGQESTPAYNSFAKGTQGSVITNKGLFANAKEVAPEQEKKELEQKAAAKGDADEVPPYEKWDIAELKAELEARGIVAAKNVSKAKAAELLYADDKKVAGE